MDARPRTEVLDGLLASARVRGWRAAVGQACASLPQLHRYATDPREADCLHLLPKMTPRRALFLGNSLGVLPLHLSGLFESVVVADSNASRLAFARHRHEEEGVSNARCVLAELIDEVTRRGGRFDLVVLGEEYPDKTSLMPFTHPGTPARLSLLIGAGGCLMYGVRFRFPAAVAKLLATPWTASAPASYSAHARSLTAASFATVAAYWRRPAGRPYQTYIPVDHPAVVAYCLENSPRPHGIRPGVTRAVTAIANRSGCLPRIVNNYLLIAQRS